MNFLFYFILFFGLVFLVRDVKDELFILFYFLASSAMVVASKDKKLANAAPTTIGFFSSKNQHFKVSILKLGLKPAINYQVGQLNLFQVLC